MHRTVTLLHCDTRAQRVHQAFIEWLIGQSKAAVISEPRQAGIQHEWTANLHS
jgi:hypothetical protein